VGNPLLGEDEAHDIVRHHPDVRSSGVFGDKIHVILDREEVQVQLIDLLREKGIEVFSTRRIPPSLEDIFISTLKMSA